MNRTFKLLVVAASISFTVGSAPVHAQAIVSATSGVINSGGPGFGTLDETFNQDGLSVGYTTDVTDFDAYIAGGPTHTTLFPGFEWFSEMGTSAATVTYNFGTRRTIDRFALWNEEGAGIGSLNIFGSIDNITFTQIGSTLSPTNNPSGSDYLANVFSFAATPAQYFRMEMRGCPQPGSSFDSCSIGEVAWRSATTVPEPSTFALLGASLAALGFAVRRRRA